MLNPVSKYRKHKNSKKAGFLIRKGLSFLEGSFFHKAMHEFQQALELDEDLVVEKLSRRLDNDIQDGNHEIALTVGRIVLKLNSQDYDLANKLGNRARKLRKYKEANDLYRQAIRINRRYKVALYNLAASMGRIPRFDDEVIRLVSTFDSVKEYILPQYRINRDYIGEITNTLRGEIEEKRSAIEEELGSTQKEIGESREDLDTVLSYRSERLKRVSSDVTYAEICAHIHQEIKASSDLSTPENVERFEGMVFNLGLFALSKKDTRLALKCFFQLKERESKVEHLDMLITLAMDYESPTKEVLQHLMVLLGKDKSNRYLNANLGLMFRKRGNKLLSYKYLGTAALLLEKTDGIYCRMELIDKADEEMELGNLKEALRLYGIIDSETDNAHVKANIAQIYIYQNRNLEAVPILKKILKKEPDHTFANQRLIEIHDYFVEKADELATVGKHSSAATFCEKALTTLRLPATLKRAEEVYRNLMNFDKAEALLKEYKKAKTTERAERKEKKRLNLIKKGKEHLKNRAFDKAIEALEEALPMETDKDVFVLLAYILKKRGRTDELENLLARWKKMVSEEGIRLDQI